MKNRIFILLFLFLAACAPHREMVYLQDKTNVGDQVEVNPADYRIRPGDILHIRVMTLDKESRELFNADDARLTTGGTGSNANFYIYGYSVDPEGQVHLPVVGSIPLTGKTLEEARLAIQEKVDLYLVGSTVNVKMVNFSVTVLGEVKSPGTYYVYDNKFTILDALGMAGDLTDYGNRKVNLVRKGEDGLSFHTIDLTSRAMVSSELYYLQPGDLVYVEPQVAKRLGFSQFPFALIFSTISTTLLLISFFNN
ncbi:MAG: polysaccharide biosynthesis/export family protein [Bacteroides sp.]|nr:polysaccharide biosynthesis/export family protein [Bacteroides sp.]